MKKILILLQLLLAITLTNCGGYKSIYSSKTHDFNIISIELDKNNEISSKIKNSLKRLSNVDSEKKIIVKISSNKTIAITSKDAKGDPKTYNMTINLNLEIDQSGIKRNNSFVETFGYNTKQNKFDLKKYERNIQNNLIEKILENAILYISTI